MRDNRQDAKTPSEEEAGWVEPDERIDALAHAAIGAAIEVHRILGPGFLESVYERALRAELKLRGIAFTRQVQTRVFYKGVEAGECFLDLLVEGCLIVELKTCESFAPIHKAQLISYLKAHGLKLGLLINFNVPLLKDGIKRVIFS